MTEPSTDTRLFRRALPLLRNHAKWYLGAMALAPLSALAVMAQPYLLKVAIDEHIVPGDVDGLGQSAMLYLVVVLAGFVFETLHTLLLSLGAMRTITEVRDRVYRHTMTRAQRYFDSEPTGRLLTRATSDVDALGETLTAGAVTVLLDFLQVVGVLGAMFWLDARLTLTLMLVGPPLALVVELFRRRLRVLFTDIRTTMATLNAYLSERLDGVETIQLYRDEARAKAGFEAHLDRYRTVTIRTNVWDALMYATVDGLSSVTMALMLWYGASGIVEGVATAGLIAAFIDYVSKLFRPIQEFSQKVAVIQRAAAALQKIFSLLDVDDAITPGSVTLEDPQGVVRLRGVSFAYGDGPDVLTDIDLDVDRGEVVALVGRTGSGKTTIGKVLTRAYDGYRGSITVDGVELSDIRPASVRHAIGAVRQDVQLFPETVRFNLTLDGDHTDAQVLAAAKLARADDIVERLGGLDGTVEHQGRNLSAGEAQLLSFARTLLFDPPFVILDEATASVDSITEARLQQATAAVLERKTTLVIAHRLSTVLHADRIAVLDAGRIVEIGSHSELLANGGVYANLFNEQFEHDTEEVPLP